MVHVDRRHAAAVAASLAWMAMAVSVGACKPSSASNVSADASVAVATPPAATASAGPDECERNMTSVRDLWKPVADTWQKEATNAQKQFDELHTQLEVGGSRNSSLVAAEAKAHGKSGSYNQRYAIVLSAIEATKSGSGALTTAVAKVKDKIQSRLSTPDAALDHAVTASEAAITVCKAAGR